MNWLLPLVGWEGQVITTNKYLVTASIPTIRINTVINNTHIKRKTRYKNPFVPLTCSPGVVEKTMTIRFLFSTLFPIEYSSVISADIFWLA